MLKIAKIFSASGFIFIFSSFLHAQTSWIGNYQFDENGGGNAGGTKISVTRRIEIKQAGGSLPATLQSNGYQTSIDLIGTVKADDEKLLIYFDSYGENNTFENYEQGDLLLTLGKKDPKRKNGIFDLPEQVSARRFEKRRIR